MVTFTLSSILSRIQHGHKEKAISLEVSVLRTLRHSYMLEHLEKEKEETL